MSNSIFRKLRRGIAVLLAMVLLVSVCPMGSFTINANAATSGYYTYTVSNGEAIITGYTGSDVDVTIPSTLDGYPVTTIGDRAFVFHRTMQSITIPDSVTSIGSDAFGFCDGLINVTIGKGVTSIGDDVFYACDSLTSISVDENNKVYDSRNDCKAIIKTASNEIIVGCKSTVIPNSVTSIGDRAFSDCSGLTNITIPDSVTSIGGSAFYNCDSLTSITIPDSVTSIGDSAFESCGGLGSVTIGDGVTSIGDDAFYYCNKLDKVNITSLEAWYNIDFDNLCSNPLYYANELYLNDTLVTNLVIPDSITEINSYAFYGCNSLTSITIPDSVIGIGKSAFTGCSGITSISVDENNKVYDSRNNCKAIIKTASNEIIVGCKSTVIPSSVTGIGDSAFHNCDGLTSITIPNSVTTIGNNAFSGCSGLTNITIPDSVTSIGGSAFYNCDSLTSITIGEGITSIGDWAFDDCSDLNRVNITSLEAWCNIDFDSHLSNPLYYANELYLNDTLVTNLVIPDSITEINSYAFERCEGLTSITIPNSVKSIGDRAFSDCSGLTNITIPDSVTSIGGSAFYNCDSLTSITIGEGITSIGDWAFHNCDRLNRVNITSLEAWCNIDFDSVFSNPLYGANELYLNDTLVTNLVIPDGVTEIKSNAFYSCGGLTSVTIPDSVTKIGSFAFENCSELTSVIIGGGVTSIGGYAFEGCYGIKSITIPNSVSKMGSDAFEKATKIICDYGSYAENWAKQKGYSYFVINLPAPERPVAETVTSNSVTLLRVEGCEYSKDGINWQENPVFSGLSHATEYTFYQRTAETETSSASEISQGIVIRTSKKNVGVIPSAPVLKEIAQRSVNLQSIDGYEYSMDGINWQASPIFDGLAPGTEYTFYQRIAETDTNLASAKSTALVVTTPKYSNTKTPPAPALAEKTTTSVRLVHNADYEYSKDGRNWQSSPLFEGLIPETEYTFYQRVAETDDTYASAAGSALAVKTNGKAACPNTPVKPIVIKESTHTVELKAVDGYEYKCGNGAWQSSPVFDWLIIDTEYTFYQRIKETDDNKASVASQGVTVKTLKPSSATNYETLVKYIELSGSGTSGSKSITVMDRSGSSYYYYSFKNTASGVLVTIESSQSNSSASQDCTMSFYLKPYERNIKVNYVVEMYSYAIDRGYTYTMDGTIDRATYTKDTVVTLANYAVGSQMSNMYNATLRLMCTFMDAYFYEYLGFPIGGIGFLSFGTNSDFDKTYFCDPASGHHLGSRVLKHKYDATCTSQGNTGDYCCSYCGEILTKGAVIPSLGGHKYSTACDESCNTCGFVRETTHTYSNDCDENCNICGNDRVAEHIYSNVCDETCNVCGSERKAIHNFLDKNDLVCDDCGYERPPYTPGDIDGVEGVTDRDAVYLLYHTFLSDIYPVNQECDFNGDGEVNDKDAVYLLYYTFLPDLYPIN